MIWNLKDETEWHPWFAWHPVYVDTLKKAWLETVERRTADDGWMYRLPPSCGGSTSATRNNGAPDMASRRAAAQPNTRGGQEQ